MVVRVFCVSFEFNRICAPFLFKWNIGSSLSLQSTKLGHHQQLTNTLSFPNLIQSQQLNVTLTGPDTWGCDGDLFIFRCKVMVVVVGWLMVRGVDDGWRWIDVGGCEQPRSDLHPNINNPSHQLGFVSLLSLKINSFRLLHPMTTMLLPALAAAVALFIQALPLCRQGCLSFLATATAAVAAAVAAAVTPSFLKGVKSPVQFLLPISCPILKHHRRRPHQPCLHHHNIHQHGSPTTLCR